jgi:sulfite exporter TauE/SafE
MCGGIAALCGTKNQGISGAFLYNLMRGISYIGLGALAGLLGSTLDLKGELLGLQRFSALLAGIVIIMTAIFLLFPSFKNHFFSPIQIGKKQNSWLKLPSSAPLIGLLSGFFPCGWLWLFLVSAAGAGSPISGALVMTAFWLGTLPILISIGGLGGILVRSSFGSRLKGKAKIIALMILFIVAGYSWWQHAEGLFSGTINTMSQEESCH